MKNLARLTNRYLAAFIGMLFLTLVLAGSFTLAVYRIETASDDYRQSLSFSGNIETMPERLREGRISFSQAIQESGAIARALSDGFHKRRDSLNLFAALAIIINLAVIFLLLAITLLLKKSTCIFSCRSRTDFLLCRR